MNVGITIQAIDIDVLIVVALEVELVDYAVGIHHHGFIIRYLSAQFYIGREYAKLLVVEHLSKVEVLGVDMSVEFALFVDSQRHIHATRIRREQVARLYLLNALTLNMTS